VRRTRAVNVYIKTGVRNELCLPDVRELFSRCPAGVAGKNAREIFFIARRDAVAGEEGAFV
jgi:hypothetical protein